MTIPDVNLLIYAYNVDFARHDTAREWWEQALRGDHGEIGLAWVAILGFVRVTTNRGLLIRPIGVEQATAIVRSWLRQEIVRLVVPGERHADLVLGLLEEAGTAGNLTTDAHLAALALEYRARIATTDADFSRFPGLKWFNPLR